MRFKFVIASIFIGKIALSQNVRDTLYFRTFDSFLHSTEKLIKQSHHYRDSSGNRKHGASEEDSLIFYATQVKDVLRKLDSIDRFSIGMAHYFENGKRERSRDLSSPIAQLQCSYFKFMESIRSARDTIPILISASLTLESHLKNGFPSSTYCPFIYDEVKFGPGLSSDKSIIKKIDSSNSLKRQK
jgi:hypothetical protein